jgi:hypothetical protein
MDKKPICLFPAFKGLSARAVYNERPAVSGGDATTYSTLTKCLRQSEFIFILIDPRGTRDDHY